MASEPQKNTSVHSYDPLVNDYDFFKKHSTETTIIENAFVSTLSKRTFAKEKQFSILEIGAGPGDLMMTVVKNTPSFKEFSANNSLSLSFVEVTEEYLKSTKQLWCQSLTPNVTAHRASLPPVETDTQTPSVDVCFAVHCLYYVPSVEKTIDSLFQRLVKSEQKDAVCLLSIEEDDGPLIGLWFHAWKTVENMPFFIMKHLENAVRSHPFIASPNPKLKFRIEVLTGGKLTFPDTLEGRRHISRFLMGEHYAKFEEKWLLSWLDKFRVEEKNQIDIDIKDVMFVIEKV